MTNTETEPKRLGHVPNVTELTVTVLESLPYQLTQTFIKANERNVPMNLIFYCFAGSQSAQLVRALC